jgi:two-component system cell cycle response regulator CpdR
MTVKSSCVCFELTQLGDNCHLAGRRLRRFNSATDHRMPAAPEKRSIVTRDESDGRSIMAKIMLAEDDEAMRQFLSAALARAGHAVESFADGFAALAAGPSTYDLLIADIVMPGMDGVELARRARQSRPELRVMFITGFAAVVLDGGRAPLPGASVLSKPFHLKDLVNHVDRLLAS